MLSRPQVRLAVGLLGVGAATLVLKLAQVGDATTIALGYLLVTLFVAAMGDLAVAIVVSMTATLCFNFFFLPPLGTLTIADRHNGIALVAFLVVSVMASRLSATARTRAHEALDSRNQLTRLFDLTRDILLATEHTGALAAIARQVARRFELTTVAICVPAPDGWQVDHGGAVAPEIAAADLDLEFASNAGAIESDGRTRANGQRELTTGAGVVTLAPLRVGARMIGLLATGGRSLEAGTRDAVAGIVAIALERLRFMEERRGAELTQQRAELASALLASLSHDLRTPLTAIRTAVSNLDTETLPEDQRREQARVASDELQRLTRLFDEILDMARIDSGTLRPRRSWTTPAEIVEAAVAHDAEMLAGHDIHLDAAEDRAVEVDARLVSSALAHLIENAIRYAAGQGAIVVKGWTADDGLRLEVRDQGPGVKDEEMARLFEPFYRGEQFRNQISGTGMGLAITRGLVAADGGRVWAENLAPRGACFSIAVPGPTRAAAAAES